MPLISSTEIEYTLNCLFRDFLGVEFTLLRSEEVLHPTIYIGVKKIVLVTDFFVSEFTLSDLTSEDLPSGINSSVTIGNRSFDYICLYGESSIEFNEDVIKVHADILGATFFMLSRWEEYVVKQRDTHDRFLASYSVAFKKGFLERPIVNEYVEVLWALLKASGFQGERIARKFTITPTHDVDNPFLWESAFDKVKSIGGQVLKGNAKYTIDYIKRAFKSNDPYDVYNLFMDKAEGLNTAAHFYFISSGETIYDKNYNIEEERIVDLSKKILDRKHVVGFHPSYSSHNNFVRLQKEKNDLESSFNCTIDKGRQHYLRFSLPETWMLWDNLGMRLDSTMSYADHVGFRCGVCYEFPVYDIVNRKQLKLREMPLIAMEVSLKNYQHLQPQEAISSIRSLKETIRSYNGNFVFLWHNSCLHTKEWENYIPVFHEMYNLN